MSSTWETDVCTWCCLCSPLSHSISDIYWISLKKWPCSFFYYQLITCLTWRNILSLDSFNFISSFKEERKDVVVCIEKRRKVTILRFPSFVPIVFPKQINIFWGCNNQNLYSFCFAALYILLHSIPVRNSSNC